MNPKDVLHQHLTSLMLLCGARGISVYHPQMESRFEDVIVGQLATPMVLADINTIEDTDFYPFADKMGGVKLAYSSPLEVIFRIPESISPQAVGDEPSSSIETRRAPIQSYVSSTFSWVKITFEEQLPSWLTLSNLTDVSSLQLNQMQHMLVTAGMQMKLVGDYVTLLSDPLTKPMP